MTRYVATINIPGYLPMDDDPPVFDTAQEAWDYLAGERERGEDDAGGEEYSEAQGTLVVLGTAGNWVGDPCAWLADHNLWRDGTGAIYGPTPGYEGSHDLGLAYSVSIAEDEEE